MDDLLRGSFAVRDCFGLDDWHGSGMIDEWALGDGTLRSVRYSQDDDAAEVMVATSDEGEDMLQHIIANVPSDGPFEQRMERTGTNDIPAVVEQARIAVSGQFVTFDVRRVDDYLIADATAEGLDIVVRARGAALEELRLVLIDDIQPYLDARTETIRKARSEHGIVDPE